jgi:hypothetical protein
MWRPGEETLGFIYGEKVVPSFELLFRVFYICDAGSGLTNFPCGDQEKKLLALYMGKKLSPLSSCSFEYFIFALQGLVLPIFLVETRRRR